MTDPLAEKIRAQIVRLQGEMPQNELARRAGLSQQRVHTYLKGQAPKASMTFMDTLLRALGSSLADALGGEAGPVRPLPVHRADVLEVARLLEGRSLGYVRALKDLLEETHRAQSRGRKPEGRRARH